MPSGLTCKHSLRCGARDRVGRWAERLVRAEPTRAGKDVRNSRRNPEPGRAPDAAQVTSSEMRQVCEEVVNVVRWMVCGMYSKKSIDFLILLHTTILITLF